MLKTNGKKYFKFVIVLIMMAIVAFSIQIVWTEIVWEEIEELFDTENYFSTNDAKAIFVGITLLLVCFYSEIRMAESLFRKEIKELEEKLKEKA